MTRTLNIPAQIQSFWEAFAVQAGAEVNARFYDAFYFGDNAEVADSLGNLVLAGTKRATAGLVWAFEADATHPPKPGDLSVVTNWSGTPLCVIETTRVDIVPFNEVSAEFAATEGEGDGSLEYWRKAHEEYFARECARIGRAAVESMPVVCERFSVLFAQEAS